MPEAGYAYKKKRSHTVLGSGSPKLASSMCLTCKKAPVVNSLQEQAWDKVILYNNTKGKGVFSHNPARDKFPVDLKIFN